MAKLIEKHAPKRLESTVFTDSLFYTLKIGTSSFDIDIVICYVSSTDSPRSVKWISISNPDHQVIWYNTSRTKDKHSFASAIESFLSFCFKLYPTTKEKIIHDIFGIVARHCDKYMTIDRQFHSLKDINYVWQWQKDYADLKVKYRQENLAKAAKEKKMVYKKMNVKETEPTVSSEVRNCHVSRNFYLDDPNESFTVNIYYQEYSDTKRREFVQIEMGDRCIDRWANKDDFYEQIGEELAFQSVCFFNKHNHLNGDVPSLLEDMLTYIQVYLETNNIEILE